MGRYRPLLVANRPFDLDGHHYLRGIYQDEAQEIVYLKAAQVGVSEYLLSWLLYMAAERDATGFYVMPTDNHVSDFSAARLGPAIDPLISPHLAALIRPAGGRQRGADKVTLKRVGNRFVYFRGGQITDDKARGPRANQLRSVDADTLILDELDELDPRVPAISRARLEHSNIAAVRIASTPTYADVGVYLAYADTDQREWFIRCDACHHLQTLGLANLVLEWDALERPLRWNGQKDDSPYLACLKCGAKLDRSKDGEWVAAYPGRPIHGYHIIGLASARKSLPEIVRGLLSTDETERQQTYNQKLGLAYKPSDSEKLSKQTLDRCRRDYGLGIYPDYQNLKLFAGIDVGRVVNIVIRGKAENGDRVLIYAGQHESFGEVARILQKYNVALTVIDALPETRKSRELQRRFSRLKVWLAYFNRAVEGAKTEAPAVWNAKQLEVDVDRTRAMDTTVALFNNASLRDEDGQPLPGNTLPGNAESLRDYYAQLMAPERVLHTDTKGNKIPVYINSQPDHYAFAELYCAMAFLCPYQGWARGAG